ncbi:MAG: hypothetical protein HDT38_04300 [Clostridiales bacterium]|nr:hypothetical protein [Clostridiales bacterium]
MGELTIRRNRGVPVARYQTVDKTEKTAAAQTQRTVKTAERAISETLQPLTDRSDPTAGRAYESRQTLQMGEVVLTEVEERLGRMMELVQEGAQDDAPDRGALQATLDQLRAEIDQIIRAAVSGGTRLFLDGDIEDETGLAIFLNAAVDKTSAGSGAAFPDWLTSALGTGSKTAEQLLNALGLDSTASGKELLAAITSGPLDGSSAAGYVAAMYLGAVIAGAASGAIDPQYALAGIQQLLDKVAGGLTPDQALELLTDGTFSGFADFETQFSNGAAPGMEDFLAALLLSESGETVLADFQTSTLLAWMESMESALLADLMSILDGGGALPDVGAADAPAEAAEVAEAGASLSFGDVQVAGQDLSGVSFDAATGELTIGGTADVLVQGTGQEVQAILLTGSGRVTIQDVEVSTLAVDAGLGRLFTVGENILGELRLTEGSSLTLDGKGLLRLGGLTADSSNTLRLTGGAVIAAGEDGQEPGALPISVIVDGPASLAARAAIVTNPAGEPLEPFDLIWKAFLPGWSSITAVAVDGQRAQMALWNGERPDLARLWLEREAFSHGFSIHTLVIQGKDAFGRPRTRYAYMRWNHYTGAFEELSMYPNPFTVTGGRQIRDWAYEEATHTLYILSNQVTAIAGGSGTDANRIPFSGRIVLADGIGALELSLGGVVCQVSAGRAFDLGRGNDVTLLLQRGSSNRFESGAGYAGISLGGGTSLHINSADPAGERDDPDGSLTAIGGEGGAGIGRDSGGGDEDDRDRTGSIHIHGGVITAAGAGGGAGIGGAVGAPVGDIRILGGTVSAEAACHAAAIGAGIQGDCGDILITGSARIIKAVGGDPGADIGACRFGRCGQIRVYGADIGDAKLCAHTGIPLQMGERTATLPQFHLSSEAMGLDDLLISTKEYAAAAKAVVEADLRRIRQMQAAYSILYSRLEMGAVTERRAAAIMMGWSPLRDTGRADKLLEDLRQEILQADQTMTAHSQGDSDDLKQLLRG